jgi:hypothetical protein
MGAGAIADDELTNLGIDILQGAGSAFRGLLIPAGSVEAYKALVRQKMTPGFWNDIVGRIAAGDRREGGPQATQV